MKKICMLAVMHSAKDDRIFFKEGRSLLRHGYEVVFVHGVNSKGEIQDMSGNILNGNGKSEIITDGIKNIGVPEPKGFFQKLLKKIFLGSFYRNFIKTAINENADIYHAHEPQSYYLALKIAKRTNAKVIYDAHESWLTGPFKDKYIKWRYLRKLTYLISANSITRDRLTRKYPNIKSEVIYNASVIASKEYKAIEEIIIAHEGSFPFNRGLKLFLEGLKLLRNKTQQFKVKVIGGFNQEEDAYFEAFNSEFFEEDFISVTGWKPYEELPQELEGASIGLILNTPTPNNLYGGPANKLFNYIANNMCVVSVDLPETTRIVNENNCGVILMDRNPHTLSDTLYDLISNRGLLEEKRKSSFEAHKTLNWNKEAEKLIRFYEEIVD